MTFFFGVCVINVLFWWVFGDLLFCLLVISLFLSGSLVTYCFNVLLVIHVFLGGVFGDLLFYCFISDSCFFNVDLL